MAHGYAGATVGKNAANSTQALADTNKVPVAGSAGGIGTDTAELYVTVKEDIGGGMTAGGTMGFGGLARGEAMYGHNYTMYVQNAMGKLTLGSTKSGDYVSSGLASSGVNYYDFGDRGNFGARSNRDTLSFDTKVGDVNLTLSHQEAGNQTGAFGGGEGSTGQRINVIAATYVAGKLKANTTYFTYDNQIVSDQRSAANVFRLSGNYNLGVATVGGGLQKATLAAGHTGTNYGVSAAVPMGALTLGAMIGSRVTEGFTSAANNGTQASYSLTANYALSKRTVVYSQYSNWDNGVGAEKSSMTMLLLGHSF